MKNYHSFCLLEKIEYDFSFSLNMFYDLMHKVKDYGAPLLLSLRNGIFSNMFRCMSFCGYTSVLTLNNCHGPIEKNIYENNRT